MPSSIPVATPTLSPAPSLDLVPTPPRALGFFMGAVFLFACLDASAKTLVLAGVATLFLVWCRFFVALIVSCLYYRVWRDPSRFFPKNRFLQVLRGAVLGATTILNFMALNSLQLAETMTVFLTAPMVITALAGPLLGEWAGWRRWAAIGVAFLGVVIVARPGTAMFSTPILYSIAAVFTYASYAILTRKLAASETTESLVIFSSLIPAVLLAPFAATEMTLPTGGFHLILLLTMGVLGAGGHFLVVKAHQLAPAPNIAPYGYTQILWMTGLGYLVFGQFPDTWTLAGAGVILASGLYLLQRERRLQRATSSD